jgi:hypothetical protein
MLTELLKAFLVALAQAAAPVVVGEIQKPTLLVDKEIK